MRKKRKKGFLVFIVFVILLIVAALYVAPLVIEYTDTTSEDGKEVIVEIPKGASSEDIAQILKEKGLIKSPLVFKLKAKQSENGSKMNYGTFVLHEGWCIDKIIDKLAENFSYEETVIFSVPEGFSVEQIAARAENLGFCTKAEFLQALDENYDYDFVKSIPDNPDAIYRLQGYLYPKTYEFYKDATAHEIIDKMLFQFEKEMTALSQNGSKNLHEMVIIASMIERECLLDSELKKISGVIHNRLDPNKNAETPTLGIDACAQYIVTEGMYDVNVITGKDVDVDSPYNTRKVPGLPPGPICNVSFKALDAAYNPEIHDYLFYHTDNDKKDGSHIFTKTYKEHLATK